MNISDRKKNPEAAKLTARKIIEAKFPTAKMAFCAGSIIRGEGTETSDIDLVIVFESLQHAWRESFLFDGWPVEAFVHDPATLQYFFAEIDAKSGTPALPQMVLEGEVIWGNPSEANHYKKIARELIDKGPDPLLEDDISSTLYDITNLIDDLRAPKSREESIGIATRLYSTLAKFALRSQGHWDGEGKGLPRALTKYRPDLHVEFTAAFEKLFSKNESASVINLAEKIAAPFGGFLFDKYRREAPSSWRTEFPSSERDNIRRSKLVIRMATEHDAGDILKSHFDAVHVTAAKDYPSNIIKQWSAPVTQERIERYLKNSFLEETTVVAEVGGQVVGFGAIVERNNELRAVYVSPSAGQIGAGSAILKRLEDLAKARGISELKMDSSLTAESFYRKHNYEVVERGEHTMRTGLKMACVKMRKQL